MYIAYSAISDAATAQATLPDAENERLLRYQAYRYTCDKYSKEIAAIQKYIPGWLPKFR